MREILPRLQLLNSRTSGPFAVFLPCEGRRGAALLRCYLLSRELQRLGWRCLVLSPKLKLWQRQRLLQQARPDILFMQGARHASNRPEFYPGQRIIYDMDDADFFLPHLAGPVERAVPQVAGVIAGSRFIADWCRARGAVADVVWTGAPASPRARVPHDRRPPVVAWAQTRPMDYRREAELVRSVMAQVVRRRPGARLRLYDRLPGDDPGFAGWFEAEGIPVEWCQRRSYRDYAGSLDDVSIGLAPLCPETPFSRGKSFGKVLAYLDRQVPVIGSDAGEHGAFFGPDTGVISNDPGHWVDAAAGLLEDADARSRISASAHRDFCARLSLPATASRIDRVLRRHLGRKLP